MKIGIMSMQRIRNYGSFMQALSLKRIVESLGHEVVFVDYRVSAVIDKHDIKNRVITAIKRCIKDNRIYQIIHPIEQLEVDVKFDDCLCLLEMNKSKQYSTKVDVLIIGSDEVFNCLQKNPRVGFSLELFGKNQRAKKIISYAASFGNTTLNRIYQYGIENILRKYLLKFDKLSVRDSNSADIVQNLCLVNPEMHLDPVLVGDIETISWKPINLKNYLIVYGYKGRFTKEEGQIIKDFAHKKNLITVSLGEEQFFCDKSIICSPDEVISYFKGADYIVTDTFHGTIFSAITHKKVAVFCRNKNRQNNTNEEKLLDLLKKIHLENRLINDLSNFEAILESEIDYTFVDKFRKLERNRTILYLENNLVL